ncbi:MAG: C10 family peptidase [Fodinibius sp.]|nr:C10 family peptidase [Fodinibius sp.]
MRYHTYPNNYNWGIMPNKSYNPNSTGSNEISSLMRDVGDIVFMNYGCDGSGAKDDHIEPGFRSFGYNSATQIGYAGTNNYKDVIDNIEQGNPVVFTGYKDTILGVIDKDGHAWVADGYRDIWDCSQGIGYLLFYMNWGWEGSYNGWFYFDNFNPGNSQYNSGTEVVVNIHP